MVFSFHVFRKSAPNGKVSVYVGRRDYTDHLAHVDPIDGMVWLERDYVGEKKVFAQVVMTYRYGREEDEVMGLTFAKEIVVASTQVYPPGPLPGGPTSLQERLQKKLGANSFPFHLDLPRNAPASVTLQQDRDETGRPCGVEWELRVFVGQQAEEQPHRRSCVRLLVRRFQYAPAKQGRQPMASCAKEFLLSPGKLHLQVTLDRQIYYHGEDITASIEINNKSNKQVKKMKVSVVQLVDVKMGPAGQIKNTVASLESQEGCPVVPGAAYKSTLCLTPMLVFNRGKRGVAIDGRIKVEETNLASSTLLINPELRDHFGLIVCYVVRVKLYMGTLGGELIGEVPFTLMNPPPQVDTLPGTGASCPRESTGDKPMPMVIEECRRMSVSDTMLDNQKSIDSLDNFAAEFLPKEDEDGDEDVAEEKEEGEEKVKKKKEKEELQRMKEEVKKKEEVVVKEEEEEAVVKEVKKEEIKKVERRDDVDESGPGRSDKK